MHSTLIDKGIFLTARKGGHLALLRRTWLRSVESSLSITGSTLAAIILRL